MMRRFSLLLLFAAGCHRQALPAPVIVLTTPGLAATGLTQRLVAAFEKESGRHAEIRVVTSEQILASALARSGAVAVFRDPELDEQLTQRQAERLRSVFAHEDYSIVGPQQDPAHVRGAPAAPEAFRRIAARKRPFCSPVSVPAVANLEGEIWSAARLDPKSNRRYVPCRGSAAEVLGKAARLQAYTVMDRANVEASRPRNLTVLLRDVPMLHWSYVAALLPSEGRQNRDAEWFVEWLMSYRGREVIDTLANPEIPKLYLPEMH